MNSYFYTNKTKQLLKYYLMFLFALPILYMTHNDPTHAATMILDRGFETGNIDGFERHINEGKNNIPSATIDVVSAPVATGLRAAKHSLIRSNLSVDTFRAELIPLGALKYFEFNREYWFGLSFRYDDWQDDNNADFAPFQVHRRPSSWAVNCGGNVPAWSNAPFFMATQGGQMLFVTMGGVRSWSAPIQKNKWINIVVHFDIGFDDNGYVELWVDGQHKFKRAGRLHQGPLDDCSGLWRTTYLNIGIYKWDWKNGRPATQSSRRVLYTDNIKIAQGANGYSLVSPTNTPNDTIPPTISGVAATAITDTAATIDWTTNESSDSKVVYGLTTAYGLTANNAALTTSHSLTLRNLAPAKLYHYKVSSKDVSGNTGSGVDSTFATNAAAPPDTTPPVISGVSATAITDTSATIDWATDEPAESLVNYGATTAYGQNSSSTLLRTIHSRVLSSLTPNTTYHYRVTSVDNARNASTSPDFSFTTNAVSEPPPIDEGTLIEISQVQAAPASTTAVVTWQTNVAVTGGAVYSIIACSSGAEIITAEADAGSVVQHKATIVGLLPATSYRFTVKTPDETGNLVTSVAKTFTTLP